MKTYKFRQQEDKYYCVPACLQMVLDRNGIKFDSQKKIIEECGNKIHIKDTLNNYFEIKNYNLHCIDFLVNQSFSREFESLTREALELDCDIIVGCALESLNRPKNKVYHVSIVYLYNHKEPDTILIDPDVSPDGLVSCDFKNLIRAMFNAEDGFHIIHKDKKVLERIRNKYF